MPTPIVVGVGDFKNASKDINQATEPMQLMLNAIGIAIGDTGLSEAGAAKLQAQIDNIAVVRTWTWPYPDLPGLLSEKLNINPSHRHYSDHGGNQPAVIFDDAARRISTGESKVAVVTGGEALASLTACAAAKRMPPPGWSQPEQVVDGVFSPTSRELQQSMSNPTPVAGMDLTSNLFLKGLGATHQIGAPIHVYPLFENGFRAHRGQSIQENNQESADLYAEFATTAEQNPVAWSYGRPAETAMSIGTVSKRNRMICFPYPLLMNAFNTVNLAGACLLTSVEYATEIGIPENRWIYPLGAAGTRDSYDFWERPSFYSSPSMSASLDAAIKVSGLTKDEIDIYDFYSCFPIVPKLASAHLGLPITNGSKPITLLGGLTSFGGAGNNYSMHALTQMVRHLRRGEAQNGLILANGGVCTYQQVVCLSAQPRRDGSPYPARNPLPPVVTDWYIPPVDREAEGEAVVETYTVEFNRDGIPLRGHIVGRLKSSGHRFLANHANNSTLQQLSSNSKEPIGRTGMVMKGENGGNVFSFDTGLRL